MTRFRYGGSQTPQLALDFLFAVLHDSVPIVGPNLLQPADKLASRVVEHLIGEHLALELTEEIPLYDVLADSPRVDAGSTVKVLRATIVFPEGLSALACDDDHVRIAKTAFQKTSEEIVARAGFVDSGAGAAVQLFHNLLALLYSLP